MKTKRKTATQKKRPAAKPSTALARIERRLAMATKPAVTPEIVEARLPEGGVLRDDAIILGNFALEELKFTAEEEAVLSRPVNVLDMRVLPTSGAVYLPHGVYTRWLNEAFGRTGWALRPAGLPRLGNGAVVVPYVLHIHGKPVAYAMGEQEYFENNRQQSYGDALEATHASALRRCCKHLGLALELWDASFADAWRDEHCVQVLVDTRYFDKGSNSYKTKRVEMWRRRVDPPIKGETSGNRRVDPNEDRGQAREQEHVGSHSASDEPISEKQLGRLWAIAKNIQRNEAELRRYLLERYGIDSMRKIRRRDYEAICAAVEHPGPLNGREPGQEG